ncbi:MAG: hypothetical protein ACI8TX_002893, partial [Hyphomicrobiaceae bacterium]
CVVDGASQLGVSSHRVCMCVERSARSSKDEQRSTGKVVIPLHSTLSI